MTGSSLRSYKYFIVKSQIRYIQIRGLSGRVSGNRRPVLAESNSDVEPVDFYLHS